MKNRIKEAGSDTNPLYLMMSFSRSNTTRKPLSSIYPRSPVRYQPPSSTAFDVAAGSFLYPLSTTG